MTTRAAVIWAGLGKFLSFGTAFVTSILIARFFLGPDDVGLFSIAFAATSVLAVLQEFGLNRYIVGEEQFDHAKLRAAFSVSFLVGCGIAALILLLSWPITWAYGDPALFPLLLVIGASYIFVPFAVVPCGVLHRQMDFRSDFMIEASSSLANASISLSLAATGWGAMALAWGSFAQQAARALVSQWRAGWIFPWPFSLRGSSLLMRFGGGSSLLLIFDAIGGRAPDLIVGATVGARGVGIYSRASGLAVQIINLMTGAANSVFYPVLARLRDEGKPLGEAYVRIVAGYTGFAFPAMAGLAAASHPLVMALYGERWIAVAPILSVLAIAQMVVVAIPMPVQIPILLGQMQAVIVRSGFAVTALIGLFVLTSCLGLAFAPLAYLAFATINSLLFGQLIHKLTRFSLRDLALTYVQSLICGAAAALPLLAAYRWWIPANQMGFAPLLLLVAAGILSWLAVVLLVRHPVRNELSQMLRDVCARWQPKPTKDPSNP